MSKPPNPWRVCIAPMLDCTDRHYRYFMRLMTQHTRLYTEMITTGALLYSNPERFLAYHPAEHPLALQLGGSDPKALAQCAQLAASYGYTEVNLNVGCPSERVKSGKFGACLMAEPTLVAECVSAMRNACQIPVTVKTRLGIDDYDSYEFLANFIAQVTQAGCQHFIIHARKAWLTGLSPKENREIPPLCYERVHQIKKDFADLTIIINGGIKDLAEMHQQLNTLDGVMVGRAAYQEPYLFAQIDQQLFGSPEPILEREQILARLLPYIELQLSQGVRLHHITRHLLSLYNGQPGARFWRRSLTTAANMPAAEGLKYLKDLKLL
ncbi:MAG: tRNA dihydrouridine(20/20a) synthase DusA [Gammaproteobacteria bacterium]